MSNTSKTQAIDNITVLKKEMTKSVTGKSYIHYEIGNDPEGAMHIRVITNTGGGYFSNEWVSFTDIYKELDRHGDAPVTSFNLMPLYAGKSVNTPAFLMASLKNEGLFIPHPEKARCYAKADPTEFIKRIQALVGKPVTKKKPEANPKAKSVKAA